MRWPSSGFFKSWDFLTSWVNCHKLQFMLIINFRSSIPWRVNIDTIEVRAVRTFIRVCCIFRSERLTANVKLTPYKAVIKCVWLLLAPPGNLRQVPILCSDSACEVRVSALLTTYDGVSQTHDLHLVLKIPHLCDFINKIVWAPRLSPTESWGWKRSRHWTRRLPAQDI
jgi:hypothetical protein